MGERLEKVVGTLGKVFVPGSLFKMLREDINEGGISKHKTFAYYGTSFFEGLRLGAYAVFILEAYMITDAIRNMG